MAHYRTTKPEGENALYGDFSTIQGTEEFIQSYLSRYKETDILINNVGSYFIAPASLTPSEVCHELFQTNLHAPLALIQALKPKQIINIGVSGSHLPHANTYATLYGMAKLSLYMLTKSLAKEGMHINMVSPGHMENSIDLQDKPFVTFGEVAEAIEFLLNNPSITGQNIEVVKR